MPTFINAAGQSAPVRCDGVSLLPSLIGKGKQDESLVYAEYFFSGKSPGYNEFAPAHRNKMRNQMQMLRFGDTVAVRYNIQSSADDFEIYQIKTDPQQTKNLASQSPAMQEYLKNRVLQIRMEDSSAARPYDNSLIPAVTTTASLQQGLIANTFACNTSWIPSTATLKQLSTKVVSMPTLSEKSQNLFVFDGYIYVPEDGTYTFSLSAGYKAFFKLHDIKAIDADYGYKSNTAKKVTLKLTKGYHPLSLYSLTEKIGSASNVKLQWSHNNSSLKDIPAASFFH
ncbi:PA14 domain-containing protein [Niabella ginsengisoli]|uniref:PA14 domain-containing protein n=1 Tax=Niabella ginsengisoli TaxID=522298 RepID=A0ABS9SIN0_9BACT|nr:PA14 domain-containing protein [Niabella ginsengisoli]MCH5598238.1 PA14 domain-containing protein [Niabella ginsengisoli]